MSENHLTLQPGATAGGPLVLLVEDERSIAEPFAQALRRAGFRTSVARTGSEALSFACSRSPDVILLDLALPDGDRRDVCRQIRRDSSVPRMTCAARACVSISAVRRPISLMRSSARSSKVTDSPAKRLTISVYSCSR